MQLPWFIFIGALILINGALIATEICRRRAISNQLSALREEKLKRGVPSENLNEDDLRDEIESNQHYSWIIAIMVCLDIWLVGAAITHLWAESFFEDVPNGDSRKALFGDSFGAVNALISAFAFAGMIVAFILQRYELRLQRKELRDNRAEMEQQTKQFEAQNSNLEIQRFENLFYNMLNLQQSIVNGLRYGYYDEEYRTVALDGGGTVDNKHLERREIVGRDVFRYLFESVELKAKDSPEGVVYGYRWYLSYEGLFNYDTTLVPTYFDHYFRHLYKIVQFVDTQNFDFEIKYRYLSFLRGTLSRYELVWLFYNTLHPSFYKFKRLIEKYSLLKALRNDLLTVSKEFNDYCVSHKITKADLEAADLNVDDSTFFLTDKTEETGKYMLSAYWNQDGMKEGEEYLEGWRRFLASKAGERK